MKLVAPPLSVPFAPLWLFAAASCLAAPETASTPAGWPSLHEAYFAAQHNFLPSDSGEHTARNLSQRWEANFDERGFVATPEQGDWQWGLELRSFGFPGSEAGAKAVRGHAEAGRLSYQRGGALEEWFVNDGRGLEQGWTLQSRPPGADGAAALRLELGVRGSLVPVISSGAVQFTDETGASRVTYSGLQAWDAAGTILASRFVPSGAGLAVEIDERNARYPITIDPIAQQAYLKASNTGTLDEFGRAVAIHGNVAVVGAPKEDGAADGLANSGAAYVFSRTGKLWTQQAYLKGNNTAAGDLFGSAVAVSGNTVAIGAPQQGGSGAVYVFERSGWIWSQQAMLKAANAGAGDQFGGSVSISGNTILAGAVGEASNGTAGPADNSASGAGAAYVFTRTGKVWSQQAYLKASNAQASDQFGGSVSISGDRAVVGAARESSDSNLVDGDEADNSAAGAGAAYVYRREGTAWTKEAYLKADNSAQDDEFGVSVSISGDLVVVGAPKQDGVANLSGAAYVFARKSSKWVQDQSLKAPTPEADAGFGQAVAISGLTAVVGAPFESAEEGVVYVFTRPGSTWGADDALTPVVAPSVTPQFGAAVAVSGDSVIAGAPLEDKAATGINAISGSDLTDAGAAYVFTGAWPFYRSFAKTGLSAPGANDISYSRPTATAASDDASVILHAHSLTGAGSSNKRAAAMFSTLGLAGSTELLVQLGDDLSGFGEGLPVGSRVSAVSEPIVHQSVQGGIFQAVVTGTGITAANNRVLLRDDGFFLRLLRRTGRGITELGGAEPNSFVEVLQSMDSDLITVSHRLRIGSGSPAVSATTDSGILPLASDGTVFSVIREGGDAYGGASGDKFGQFGGVASAARGGTNRIHFTAAMLPATGGAAKQAVFFADQSSATKGRAAMQGEAAWGASPALFASFPAIGELANKAVFRATLTGVASTMNEGVFSADGNKLLLQKGVAKSGFTVTRIIRVWPVGTEQAVFHVVLGGTGVTSLNNTALLLLQENNTLLSLLRTDEVAPGVGLSTAKVASIQSVDVNPVNGHYAIVGSLRGVSATSNQVLWAGVTSAGNPTNDRFRRLPSLRLRKGDVYSSQRTPQDVIRAITLRPATERTGIGARGLGQAVGINGDIVVSVTTDRRLEELLLVKH